MNYASGVVVYDGERVGAKMLTVLSLNEELSVAGGALASELVSALGFDHHLGSVRVSGLLYSMSLLRAWLTLVNYWLHGMNF